MQGNTQGVKNAKDFGINFLLEQLNIFRTKKIKLLHSTEKVV